MMQELFPIPLDEQRRPICHPDRRLAYPASTLCRSCYDRQREEQRPELRAKRLAYNAVYGAAWHQRNRERRLQKAREKYRGEELSALRELDLQKRYRLALADYELMLAFQGGVCAICRRPPRGKTKGKRLYVDHDHDTGAVRGLLCAGCNTALGQFLHSPEILRVAIKYLKRG